MSAQTLSAGSGADNAAVGTHAWTNPGNVAAAGDATVAIDLFGGQTHYLAASSFGFSIPSGATINGIKVTWNRKLADGSVATNDTSIRLLKGGSVVGTDKSTGAAWTTSYANAVFGANNDLWGETWTPGDINASNFGAVLSATKAVSADEVLHVDSCTIEVTYTPIPDVGTMGNPSGAWLRMVRRVG